MRHAPTRARRLLPPVVALGLLVVLIAIAFDPRAVARELATADPVLFALGFVAVAAALGLWAEAHRRLLARVGGPLSPWRCLLVYLTGMFARLALPVGYASGAAVLAYAFARETDVGGGRALASVTVVEIAGIIASGALAAASALVLLAAVPGFSLGRPLASGLALGLSALGLLAAVAWHRRGSVATGLAAGARLIGRTADGLSGRGGLPVPTTRFADRADRLSRAFAAVSDHPRTVAATLALSLAGWLVFSLALHVSALALGHQLSLAVVLFAVPVAGYANVLPTPGGLGGYEAALAGTLHLLVGVDPAAALAVTLLFRLPTYWFPLLVGALASAYVSGAYPRVTSR